MAPVLLESTVSPLVSRFSSLSCPFYRKYVAQVTLLDYNLRIP